MDRARACSPPNNWLAEFQLAFGSSAGASELISADNIALAIGEYQRSMVFADTAWKSYVDGRLDAINESAKKGAVLFFTPADEGGAGCSRCHSGDFFTDEKHHVAGAPQIGPGKGDPDNGDFGREQQTSLQDDRFKFRTPSLLNASVTGPYFHSGAYNRLADAVDHYGLTEDKVLAYLALGDYCDLPQFENEACGSLFPNVRANTRAALQAVMDRQTSDPDSTIPDITALPLTISGHLFSFVQTLTDSCVEGRACLNPRIPQPGEAPDAHQLNATNAAGEPL